MTKVVLKTADRGASVTRQAVKEAVAAVLRKDRGTASRVQSKNKSLASKTTKK
jgi:hypothetical protein